MFKLLQKVLSEPSVQTVPAHQKSMKRTREQFESDSIELGGTKKAELLPVKRNLDYFNQVDQNQKKIK